MAIIGPWTFTEFPAPPGTDTTAGDRTFTTTGSATYKAAAVVILCPATAAPVTGVLYGGVAMTLSAFAVDTSEAGNVSIYTLVGAGAGATGTVTVTLQGCTTQGKRAQVFNWEADAAALEVGDTTVLDTQGPNTTRAITVNPTAGQSAMAVGGMHDGNTAPPIGNASYTTLAGTAERTSVDWGTRAAEVCSTFTADTSGTITFGWTTTVSEDWCFAAVAIQEAGAGAPAEIPPLTMAPMSH